MDDPLSLIGLETIREVNRTVSQPVPWPVSFDSEEWFVASPGTAEETAIISAVSNPISGLITTDLQPTITVALPSGWTLPGPVNIERYLDSDGRPTGPDSFGPFVAVGNQFTVTVDLNLGTYRITGTPASNGDPRHVGASFVVSSGLYESLFEGLYE